MKAHDRGEFAAQLVTDPFIEILGPESDFFFKITSYGPEKSWFQISKVAREPWILHIFKRNSLVGLIKYSKFPILFLFSQCFYKYVSWTYLFFKIKVFFLYFPMILFIFQRETSAGLMTNFMVSKNIYFLYFPIISIDL